MPLTNESLTLWELGHRLAGESPYRRWPFGVSPAVRDNFRLLLNEIHAAHLESSLLMEKRPRDSDLPPRLFIRHHLGRIEACVRDGFCRRTFLEYVEIDRWEFRHWCLHFGYPLPDFWYAHNYRWPEDDEDKVNVMDDAEDAQGNIDALPDQVEGTTAPPGNNGQASDTEAIASEKSEPEDPDKARPSTRIQIACQEIAKLQWKKPPYITIADMIRSELIQSLAGRYADKTLRTWLSRVAPPEVSEKRGRPKKKDNDL